MLCSETCLEPCGQNDWGPSRFGSFDQYFQYWVIQFLPISRNAQITCRAAICWAIWKLKNRACFEKKKLIKTHVELICYACVFIKLWAGLHEEEEKKALHMGADELKGDAMDEATATRRSYVPLLGASDQWRS